MDESSRDIRVSSEGNIALDEIVEENTKRPNGGLFPIVRGIRDPLGGGIHTGSFEICVVIVFNPGATSKINEMNTAILPLDHDVLVLDVSMEDSKGFAFSYDVDHLVEYPACFFLAECPFLRDIVEEITTIGRIVHDDEKSIGSLVPTVHTNDAANGLTAH